MTYAFTYLLASIAALAFAGLLVGSFRHYDPDFVSDAVRWLLAGGLGVSLLTAVLAARAAAHRDRLRFLGLNAATIASLVLLLLLGEVVGRLRSPGWPAVALHGVDPKRGARLWGRVQTIHPAAVETNSWGQRDRERGLAPQPQVPRVAFVGDSFLEESSIIPLNLLVEAELGKRVEVLNLGVSASSPRDYFWRVKNVALPLGATHVYVFFFVGNDLQRFAHPPLIHRLRQGVFDVPPADSLLWPMLPGWSALLGVPLSTTVRAWIVGDIHEASMTLLEDLRSADSARLPELLVGISSARSSDRARDCLAAVRERDLSQFRRNAVQPDLGLMRKDLFLALCAEPSPAKPERSVAGSLTWTRMMKQVCDERGVRFTPVIVPQGFEIDDRFHEHWLPLVDQRAALRARFALADAFKRDLRNAGIEFVDLYRVFEGQPGTYLNFDGHWSAKGNRLAARALSQHIVRSHPDWRGDSKAASAGTGVSTGAAHR